MRTGPAAIGILVAVFARLAGAAPSSYAGPFEDIPGRAAPGSLVLGEGWGCVLVAASARSALQCWYAGSLAYRSGSRPDAPVARVVPWLRGRSIDAGFDRVCAVIAEQIHCWALPGRYDMRMRELPVADSSLPDANTGTRTFRNSSAIYDGFVGAEFACAVKANDLWCAGDDHFGQLGRGPAPHDRPALLHLAAINDLAVGAWHVCATGDDARGRNVLRCWGRDDVGQLGYKATETCAVRDRSVSCSRAPQVVPFDLRMLWGLTYAPNRPRGKLHAGDLFTCAWQPQGVVCWGASRDGFFGTPGQCPAGLQTAWPALPGGKLTAPNAACSTTPALVPGSDDVRFRVQNGARLDGKTVEPATLTQEIDTGPRGLCLVAGDGEVWCRGAIASPRALGAKALQVAVSRGSDPAACAILDDGRLVCWGEGYSPPRHADVAVSVKLADVPPFAPVPNPSPASIDGPPPPDGRPWPPACQINRECPVVARTLAPCSPEVVAAARPIADLAPSFEQLNNQTVSVRGPLATGHDRLYHAPGSMDDLLENALSHSPRVPGCRANRYMSVAVGPLGAGVDLDGDDCQGDESRICCSVPVKGQTVVASGLLRKDGRAWRLTDDVKLCAVAP